MSPLVKKEIRLILPAWIMAVSLAAIPPWLIGVLPGFGIYGEFTLLLAVAISILAIASFSREASLGTFSHLLAQPISRHRVWRMKLAVLLPAMLVTFLTLVVSWSLRGVGAISLTNWWDTHSWMAEQASFTIQATGIFMIAAIGGGLWTSIVLRQFASAFWITLLVPICIIFATAGFLQAYVTDSILAMALLVASTIYGIAGFIFAGVAFLRAQDIPWTGTTITLPSIAPRRDQTHEARSGKPTGPIAALFIKEFRLQEINVIFAAALVVLHLAALLIHPHLTQPTYKDVLTILIWLLWTILPALISGSSVAEERRLGTADAGLCLPLSRRVQFAVKLTSVLGIGLLLGIVVPVLIEVLTGRRLSHSDFISSPFGIQICTVALISFISFYGSTLSRNLLQALGVSLAWGGLIYVILNNHELTLRNFGASVRHWNPRMLFWTATPTMVIAFLYLAFQNFQTLNQGFSVWRRNITIIVLTFAGVLSLNAAAYQRAWEIFIPEPTHGAARFTTENPPIAATWHSNYKIKLPDGRCWVDNLLDYNWLGDRLSGGPRTFLPGTNWLQIGTVGWLTVGIRKDGTLWVSQPPAAKEHWLATELIAAETTLKQLGTDSDWTELACNPYSTSIALLKTNGTLWVWNSFTGRNKPLDFLRQRAQQLGTDTDWIHLVSTCGIFAFKTNSEGYTINRNLGKTEPCPDCFDNTLYLRNTTLAHQADAMDAVVKSDGTLWFFINRSGYGQFIRKPSKPFEKIQVDSGTNWIAATLCQRSIIAVNKDGSLWQWHLRRADRDDWINRAKLTDGPEQIDDHQDWVAVTSTYNTIIGVSADGSIWSWERDDYGLNGRVFAPSKGPKRLANIFDAQPSKAR